MRKKNYLRAGLCQHNERPVVFLDHTTTRTQIQYPDNDMSEDLQTENSGTIERIEDGTSRKRCHENFPDEASLTVLMRLDTKGHTRR